MLAKVDYFGTLNYEKKNKNLPRIEEKKSKIKDTPEGWN